MVDAAFAFDSIPSCIEAFASGSFLIVLDSPSRENEGDLIIAAAALTPSKAAFMIRHTSGYLCAPLSAARAKHLNLPPMIPLSQNADPNRTAYAVTVDAVGGAGGEGGDGDATADAGGEGGRKKKWEEVTTGISAHDRSVTCRVLGDPSATERDLRRPGHVVPLHVREGGVRVRLGHTEAGWEFARLSGFEPAVAVIGEMVVDGEPSTASDSEPLPNTNSPESGGQLTPELHNSGMMRTGECLAFGRKWGIKCCTIEALADYVEEKEGRWVNGS